MYGTILRFWENKGRINEIDPDGWFQWYLDTGWVEDEKMIKEKSIDGKKLLADSKVNQLRWSNTLVVNLMIIQSCLRLDQLYCIGVMN